MSGGSYNYLCYAGPEDIGRKEDDLLDMADRIYALGYPDIAIATKGVLASITEFEQKIQSDIDKLYEVWRAVEWLDSGDYGLEQAIAELEAYRDKHK